MDHDTRPSTTSHPPQSPWAVVPAPLAPAQHFFWSSAQFACSSTILALEYVLASSSGRRSGSSHVGRLPRRAAPAVEGAQGRSSRGWICSSRWRHSVSALQGGSKRPFGVLGRLQITGFAWHAGAGWRPRAHLIPALAAERAVACLHRKALLLSMHLVLLTRHLWRVCKAHGF